ncbi:MAG: DUF3160 domain-containing protein, partial [Planctomycetota bacterium]|nr:DUF3160 domain-containing protein [Planctomycetota bacterium]
SPIEALDAARRLFGPALRLADMGDSGKVAAWRAELDKAFKPRVADQPQTKPGAEPTRGVRFLCPGVSVRALAFQAVAAQALVPRGEHVLHVLGNPAAGVPADEQALLAPAVQDFAARRQRFHDGLDLHDAALHVLAHLDGPWADGYPGFMRNEAWQLKAANCQLGAWSEIEHDLFLNAKDNAEYMCRVGCKDRFHGYVEPVPAYFADLASLVRQTLDSCEALDLFRRMKPDKDKPEYRTGELRVPRDGIVPTRKHYETLEALLLKLKRMAEKELEEQDFDAAEIELLKRFGGTLKYLSFDESNKPNAHEPMSVIVRLVREYQQQHGGYAGVGRPLWIGVIVPWKGKLHWATGATYSYYQFQRPLAEPLDDTAWKLETFAELPRQREKPWLLNRGLGLDAEVWDAACFARWLPAEWAHFGGWCSGGSWRDEPASDLGSLGFVTLDEGARAKAAEVFASLTLRERTRATLFLWLRTAPAPVRQQAALQALRTIRKRADTQKVRLDSPDYSLWCFLSFCLLEGTPGWREAEAAGVPMEALRAAFRDRKEPAGAGWSKLGEFLAK